PKYIPFSFLSPMFQFDSIPADFDNDCDVDFLDYSHFAQYWLVDCYSDPNLCGGTDLVENNFVDMNDLVKFISHWLEGVN
ncbi:unnamed protein product, partial [marine sediment metagenome]